MIIPMARTIRQMVTGRFLPTLLVTATRHSASLHSRPTPVELSTQPWAEEPAGVTTANNVIAIGISGENVSNSCYIGHIYSNIQPQVGTDPDLVTINSDGRLGTPQRLFAPIQT